ncbi:unnamed protein product [Triticum turgidum subsp. durum]|uniref:Chitinase n=1 Tax=Triticum turgidum subsp. durum TaxID=4567 RepID=A0A9R0R2B9_TRITD|nr:unnamed protein product [Triticum turgidum subsp. durum]
MALTRRWAASLLLLLAATLLAGSAAATGKTGNVVVFWGRNKDEGSLREACDTGTYTIAVISFLDVFGRGKYHLDLSGHDVSAVGADIKYCQSKKFFDDPHCAANWQQEWGRWTAEQPGAQIYFGLPASEKTVGYVHPLDLYYDIIPVVQKAANYGGIMVWDRYEDKRTGFSSFVINWA